MRGARGTLAESASAAATPKPCLIASAEQRLAAREAFGRPQFARFVIGLDRRNARGQGDPAQLGADVDVDVRWQRLGLVERADPDEAQLPTAAVVAPDRDLAVRAAVDGLRRSAFGGDRNRLRLAREPLDTIRLDQRVDDEGAAGLPLAFPAVAAVDEHRLRLEPVSHPAAGAAAFQFAHRILLTSRRTSIFKARCVFLRFRRARSGAPRLRARDNAP